MSSPARKERKRKWDEGPPVDVAAAAAAAAAEVTSRLGTSATAEPSADTARELEINDHAGRRFAMMSGNLHAIERSTGAVIVAKGRYYAPGEAAPAPDAPDAARKLFLKVAGAPAAVAEAVRLLERAMEAREHADRVWADMDPASAPGFDVAARLAGPAQEYLRYIERETGAQAALAGRGAPPPLPAPPRDNLHIALKAPSPQALAAAKTLATSLVKTVQPVFYEYRHKHFGIPPPVPRAHQYPRQQPMPYAPPPRPGLGR